ncbi:MAG: YitT family protein [Salinarimonadaceae bacterium]|nr:MAG: YitT family protein [Salinarimonadaceae bacterium]
MREAEEQSAEIERHGLYEDAAALALGTLIVALGLHFYAHAGILTSGLAGLALLIDYTSPYGFATIFFALNLPFFAIAFLRLGMAAAFRTIIAIALVSLFSKLTPEWVRLSYLDPVYAAIFGGAIIGIGLLVLFRHRTGLGGINLVAIWLQERFGLRAGWVLLAADLAILAAASAFLPLDKLALSIMGASVLNLILAINHRPGRYVGRS